MFELFVLLAILLIVIMLTVFAWNLKKNPNIKLSVVEGDEDIKIAGNQFGSEAISNEDQADRAAEEFLRQKEAGNIEVAGQLGELIAAKLWQSAQELIMNNDPGFSSKEIHNNILLKSYAANTFIANHAPSALLAETALSVFYKRAEELSDILYKHLSDTAAFSLYILNLRTQDSEDETGRIFAKLNDAENDPEMIKKGNLIFANFYEECGEMFKEEIKFNI